MGVSLSLIGQKPGSPPPEGDRNKVVKPRMVWIFNRIRTIIALS